MKNANYTCVIIDDEPQAIELLKYNLSCINRKVTVAGTYTSWEEGLEGLRNLACDIIFLDIDMQGQNGMDILRCLPAVKSEVIFVTAFAEYALEAFGFPTSGYLLKPICKTELSVAVDRAIERRTKDGVQASGAILNNKIGIAVNNAINYVNLADIFYFEALNAYTKIFTRHEDILSSYNLGRFKELLPAPPFFQIHRSYIVNLDHIKQYKSSGVVLVQDTEIPVSKNCKEQFLNLFKVVAGHQ